MVIFLNADGTATNVTPEHVYQGSDNVTEITVIGAYSAYTALSIGFILPNDLYWEAPSDTQEYGGNYAPMEGVTKDLDTVANAWTYSLPQSVTEIPGKVGIAILATTAEGERTSYVCEFTVEESVLPILPASAPDPDVYKMLLIYIGRLNGRTANVPHLIKSIQKVAPNAITFTDNSNIVSAPIVIEGGDTAPMPVGAASTILIPEETAWQPVYDESETVTGYTATITAAQHGQMRDGATANDLWVSFDETENGVITGANTSYTVSERGDITLSSKVAIQTTVRVWNGKGLVDVIAREEITAEVERAKAVEDNLQSQIDEIEQSGVDLKARAEIAAEAARAQAVEQALQNAIDTNASEISGLREDMTEIESYIPSSTSADNQLADKDFVNSSINNMAAFYITSDAQGEAFATRADLLNATAYYYGGQPRMPTQNDYAIVLADESQPKGVDGSYPTTRYSYQGGTYPSGQWAFQYIVNNTSLTQAQVNAINSGITAELVEQIGKGNVLSVNGKTGAVTLTANDVDAVPKTGGEMTGPLEVPLLQGVGDNRFSGIVPVKYIERDEIGMTTSNTMEEYICAWLKKVCQMYPNYAEATFIGNTAPTSVMQIIVTIYETNEVNADGIPRYCMGYAHQYPNLFFKFSIQNYVYNSGWTSFTISRSAGDTYYYAQRTDTGNQIYFGIGSGGVNRGIYDQKLAKWIFHTDGTKVYVNGVAPYSSANPPQRLAHSTSKDKTGIIESTFLIGSTINLERLGFTASPDYIGGTLFITVGSATDPNIAASVVDSNTAVVIYNNNVSPSAFSRRYQSKLYYFTFD